MYIYVCVYDIFLQNRNANAIVKHQNPGKIRFISKTFICQKKTLMSSHHYDYSS